MEWKMNILVTGATGFLGFNLCLRLKQMGMTVYGLGRNIQKGEKLKDNGINFIQESLENKEGIEKACIGMDYVFHCGAKSSAWGKYEEFYQSNVVGTKNIINACFKNKVKRLIHVSSPSIYFEFKDKLNIKESDVLPGTQVNYYATTKKMAEDEIDKAFENGLPVITIRPRAIFGVGDTALLPRLIRSNKEKFIPLICKSDILIDITHVDNVVESLICAMNTDNTYLGEKYNITNDEPIYMYDFLSNLMEKLKIPFKTKKISYKTALKFAGILEFISKTFLNYKEPVFTKYTVGLLAFSQTLDIQKAKKELNYKPIKSIQKGVEELVKYNEKTHEYC